MTKVPESNLSKNIVLEVTQTQNFTPNSFIPEQATSDEQIINLWLYGKSDNSIEAYTRDVYNFLDFVNKPIRQILLQDLQNYSEYIKNQELKPRSQQRKLAAIKSLMSFATKLGYISFDIGKPLKLPKSKDDLASRILDETTVIKIIHSEPNLRNQLFLKLSYILGARVSEVIALTWNDININDGQCVVTLYGKGDKTRNVLLPINLYFELESFNKLTSELVNNKTSVPSTYIFISRKTKSKLSRVQAFNIVKAAVKRIGVDKNVSPHWFRHAHASHALAKGAPMPLIQRDLGHSSLAITGKYLHVKPTDGSGLYLSI